MLCSPPQSSVRLLPESVPGVRGDGRPRYLTTRVPTRIRVSKAVRRCPFEAFIPRPGLSAPMFGLELAPLETSKAESYWSAVLPARTDGPTADGKVHINHYLALPPKKHRTSFAFKE